MSLLGSTMYAEIKIATVSALPSTTAERAQNWFAPTADPRATLNQTEWHGVYDLLSQVILAKLPPSYAIIIFQHDAAALKVHVELTTKPNMRQLKDVAEETAGDVRKFLSSYGIKIDSLKIRVYAEGEHLEKGSKLRWHERVLSSARKEIPGRLSVPVATFLVSMMLDSDVQRAAINGLAALAGVFLWLLLSATLEKSSYRYE